MNDTLKQHLIDIVKGAIGAAITAATLAMLQYLGAHIPDVLQLLAPTGGGVVAIKALK